MKKNLSTLPATKADLKILEEKMIKSDREIIDGVQDLITYAEENSNKRFEQVDTQLQELNGKMDRVLDKLDKV